MTFTIFRHDRKIGRRDNIQGLVAEFFRDKTGAFTSVTGKTRRAGGMRQANSISRGRDESHHPPFTMPVAVRRLRLAVAAKSLSRRVPAQAGAENSDQRDAHTRCLIGRRK